MAGGASEEEAMALALAQMRDDVLARNLAPLRQARRRSQTARTMPRQAPRGSTGSRRMSAMGRGCSESMPA
jgi:hypothetical protein